MPNSAVPTCRSNSPSAARASRAFPAVSERRGGVDHGHRHALADAPTRRRRQSAGGRHRLLRQVEALIQPVAAELDVIDIAVQAGQRIARTDHVAAAEDVRVDPEPPCQRIDRLLHGEHGLAQPIAPECAAGHGVGVGGRRVHPAVGAAILPQHLAAGMVQHRRRVVAVSAGIGHHVQRQRRQQPVPRSAGTRNHVHGVARGGRGDLLGAGQLQLHGPAEPERGEGADILDQHLLLAAKAAADPFAHHADAVLRQAEQVGQRLPDQEWHLGAGAHDQPDVLHPGDDAMRLHGGMLDALQVAGDFLDGVRRGKSGLHVAGLRVDLRHDVARRVGDAAAGLGVQDRRAGLHGGHRVKHGGQDLVVHAQRPAARLRRRNIDADDRGHALPGKAHHLVQQAGVIRVCPVILMPGGGIQPGR